MKKIDIEKQCEITTNPAANNIDLPINVYALFSDRTAAKIVLAVFNRREGDPVIVRCTSNNESVRKSAERGFFSAMSTYEKFDLPAYSSRDIVWDFDSNPYGLNNYDGFSAGLAFFIRFLVHLLKTQQLSKVTFSVAATGELSDHSDLAEINPIKFLPDKLLAAFSVLKSGDKIFYPLANQDDINDSLRQAAKNKEIELIPVVTTAMAAEIIKTWFVAETPHDPNIEPGTGLTIATKPGWLVKFWGKILHVTLQKHVFLILAATLILAGFAYFLHGTRMDARSMSLSIERGEFVSVPLERLQAASASSLHRLAQQTQTPLTLKNSFIYLDEDQQLLHDAASLSPMQNVALSDNDGYRFEVEVDRSCFFYLFQFQDDETVELLFPASSFDLNNHFLQDHQLYLIPASNNYFYFKSSDSHRMVTLYFLGTLWRARDIEELCLFYDRALSNSEKKKYRDRLILAIQNRATALTSGWKGLYLQQGYFWRQLIK